MCFMFADCVSKLDWKYKWMERERSSGLACLVPGLGVDDCALILTPHGQANGIFPSQVKSRNGGPLTFPVESKRTPSL